MATLSAPRITPPSPLLPAHARLVVAIRFQRCWTEEQLADQLGVHPITVSRWERGEREPHPGWITLLRGLLTS